MALKKNMELWQIKEFLEEEVKEQIFLETAPLLYTGQEVGGYFGVTRQVLCFIDFFGALFSGYNGKDKYKNGAKKISTSKKAIIFITEVLGEIDPKYKENGKYLYAIYRHGLVHLYQPRTVKQKNGRIIIWAPYKGPRERANLTIKTDKGDFSISDVRHLQLVTDPRDKQYDLLPVSILCLYKDLLTAIDKYYELLKEDRNKNLLKNWQSTANAILEPEEYLEDGGD